MDGQANLFPFHRAATTTTTTTKRSLHAHKWKRLREAESESAAVTQGCNLWPRQEGGRVTGSEQGKERGCVGDLPQSYWQAFSQAKPVLLIRFDVSLITFIYITSATSRRLGRISIGGEWWRWWCCEVQVVWWSDRTQHPPPKVNKWIHKWKWLTSPVSMLAVGVVKKIHK